MQSAICRPRRRYYYNYVGTRQSGVSRWFAHSMGPQAAGVGTSRLLCPRPIGGILEWRDPLVCLSHGAAACLGYRHAGCLQLSHRRPAEMCGLRTRPRTDVDPPQFLDPRWPDWRRNELPSAGAYRLAFPGSIPCFT